MINTVSRLILSPLIYLLAMNSTANAWINLSKIELDNALQIYLIEQRRAPVVMHLQIYKTGGTDDPLNAAGMAHFLEHMTFQDPAMAEGQDYSERMAELGAEENAFTSRNATVYHQSLPRESLEPLLEIEARRPRGLVFDEDAVELEKQKVLEERRMSSEETPLSRFNEAVSARIYGTNQNSRPLIGTQKEIEAYNAKSVSEYYANRYAGLNMVLIAGDVGLSEINKLVENNYANLPKAGSIKNTAPDSADFTPWKEFTGSDDKEMLFHEENLPAGNVAMFWEAPSLKDTTSDQQIARILAARLLERVLAARNGPLLKHFVHDQAKLLWIDADFNGMTRTPGFFQVNGDVSREEASLEHLKELRAEILEVLKDFRNKINLDDLKRAKDRAQAYMETASDSVTHSAFMVADMLSAGLDAKQITQLLSKLEEVTLEEVLHEYDEILKQKPITAMAFTKTAVTTK